MKKQLDVGAGTGVGVAATLINGLIDAAHSALHVVIPMAATADSAIDFENQAVFLDRYFGDLDLVANARSRAVLLANLGPLVPVVVAVDIEVKRFSRTRQVVLDGGEFGVEATQEFDSLLIREVCRW
jgi:hypothetical protein